MGTNTQHLVEVWWPEIGAVEATRSQFPQHPWFLARRGTCLGNSVTWILEVLLFCRVLHSLIVDCPTQLPYFWPFQHDTLILSVLIALYWPSTVVYWPSTTKYRPVPASTDPVASYINQYHSLLTQYYQVSTLPTYTVVAWGLQTFAQFTLGLVSEPFYLV